MEKAHPEEPHWYLAVVGADPSRQGSGAGRAVIQAVLDDCDAQGLPAYLESSNPANVPYYARLGFQATGDLTPPGGPTLTLMWRDPR
jgi:predicted N-acetyltransferase YhbS